MSHDSREIAEIQACASCIPLLFAFLSSLLSLDSCLSCKKDPSTYAQDDYSGIKLYILLGVLSVGLKGNLEAPGLYVVSVYNLPRRGR